MFKGETLKGLLNEAYAFSVFGLIAFYATIGLDWRPCGAGRAHLRGHDAWRSRVVSPPSCSPSPQPAASLSPSTSPRDRSLAFNQQGSTRH